MIKCPFCHSEDIELEHDYNEVKKELVNHAPEINEMFPEIKDILNTAILYNPYDDDSYLKRLEEKGLSCYCKNCGYAFYEHDEDLGIIEPTEITKEEFVELLNENLDENSLPIFITNGDSSKDGLIDMLVGGRKKFYKEMAYKVIENFKDSANAIENAISDDENAKLPS